MGEVKDVTPFAGVWIEIPFAMRLTVDFESLPSRECGLKYPFLRDLDNLNMSLPSRECGLKFLGVGSFNKDE